VFYAHEQTAKGQAEAGFGVEFDWDVPLLEGYPHRFLKNVSKRPGTEWFGGCDCPEIEEILVKEGFTHVLLIGWHKKVFWQAFWAAKKAGIPVFCRGDSQLEMTQGALKRAVKFVAYRFLLPRFDAHLYVGRRNLEYLKHYGVSDARKMGDRRWGVHSHPYAIYQTPSPKNGKPFFCLQGNSYRRSG